MIRKWQKCLEKISEVQCFSYLKLKHGKPMESSFAEPVYQTMQFIKNDSMLHICSFDGKIKGLSAEKNKYVQSSRSEPLFRSQAAVKKAYFHDVDALAHLLKCLEFEDCQYSAMSGDDGLFLGAVMLSFPSDQNMVLPGDTCIEASHPKETIAKAHNAAAREAIFYLEKNFNVEIAAFNEFDKVVAEQEIFVWKGLNQEVIFLDANVLKYWDGMLDRLDQSITANKNICSMLEMAHGRVNEMDFIFDLIGRLEFAADNCRQSFKVAAVKFGSLK